MRQQLCLFKVLTNALTMILTLVVCWMVLGTVPLCDYNCIKLEGQGNCMEVIESAADKENPNCLGPYSCHPAAGREKKTIHVVLDDSACKTSTGKYHLQHTTTIEWDTNKDGRTDIKCKTFHSCP